MYLEQYLKLDKLVSEYSRQRRVIFDKALQDIIEDVFKKYPDIESFGWDNYYPGFNDGDACVPHAHLDTIFINDENLDDTWDERDDISEDDKDKLATTFFEKTNYIQKQLELLEEKDILDRFGEYTGITIYKDGRIEENGPRKAY
jgi:hypothetical protein